MKNGPYELVVAPDDYPGKKYRGRYIYEHHLVWWENTGEIVPEGHVVHHKNEDKRDNRFNNLELLSGPKHSSLHNAGETKIELECAWCGGLFLRAIRNVNTKRKQGQTRFFCSRSHQALYQHSPIAQSG